MKNFLRTKADIVLKRCPKSGKIIGFKFDNTLSKIWFPVVGILAVIWFLVRVIPKPSRAAYPCQQAAAGIGIGFISYLYFMLGSYPLFKFIRNKTNLTSARILIIICVISVTTTIGICVNSIVSNKPNLSHIENVNNPLGEAIGIFPGRVVWTQDFNSTSWDGKNGFWWDYANLNQQAVDKMLSNSIKSLTGAKTDAEAWKKLFIFHNKKNGRGKNGYKKGEKIVIKMNCNAIGNLSPKWGNMGYPSPQMINALVKQLIEVAQVQGSDIIITDPSRYIGEFIYNIIRSNPSPEFRQITFEQNQAGDLPGFKTALPDTTNKIFFVMPGGEKAFMYLPQSFTDATYLINLSLVRPHTIFGITSVAKNHFGSVFDPEQKRFHPVKLHAFAISGTPTPNKMGDTHCSPVLLGHNTNYSKTFLYLADGIYTAYNQGDVVKRWSTMGDDWFSSILMSEDPVALESVIFDFISSEPDMINGNSCFNGNQDNALHESALADNPPSGTIYDPENDGTRLHSLGVHEHWNNNADKEYSRNLGKGKGIELIAIRGDNVKN
jgi:hypothetical protein